MCIALQWVDITTADGDSNCTHSLPVCGCESGKQTNWIIKQYINVSGAALSQLVLNATISGSSTYNNTWNCSQTLGIRILETNEENETSHVNTSSYSTDLANLTCTNESVTILINISSTGLYLAIVDTPPGACLNFTRLVLYYFVCPAMVVNGTKYPETVAPASFSSSKSVKVAITCVDNATLTVAGAKAECNSEGKWSAIDSTCNCDKGYYLLNNTCEGKHLKVLFLPFV